MTVSTPEGIYTVHYIPTSCRITGVFYNMWCYSVSYFWRAVDFRNRDEVIIHRSWIHSCIFSIVAVFYYSRPERKSREISAGACWVEWAERFSGCVITERARMKCGRLFLSVVWGKGAWHLNLSHQKVVLFGCVCVWRGSRVRVLEGGVVGNVENVNAPYAASLWKGDSLSSLPLFLCFCLSDKLFGKRLLQAGRHIMSHKSWMKTVPTENCDVLMTFAGQV